jgi:hypothetical protein
VRVEVRTQAELDAALAKGDLPVLAADITFVIREGSPTVVANGSPRVVAYDSSQPTVVAYDSSQPTVVAYDSSQPTVVANDSSQPRVVAYDSSQPTVVANDSSQPTVVAYDSSQPTVEANGIVQLCVKGAVKVTAAAAVAIAVLGGSPLITGGGFISRKDISTPAKWCDFYGARVSGGVAILFKAVKQDFTPPCHTGNGVVYSPGTSPVAPDWDGGKAECGGGLHFSPNIPATLKFHSDNPRWMACPVALADLVVHPDGQYPEKVKARGCAAPIWEVDRDGEPVAGAVVSWPPAEPAPAAVPAKATKRRKKAAS